MFGKKTLRPAVVLLATALVGSSLFARSLPRTDEGGRVPSDGKTAAPAYCLATHNVGKMALGVTNYGTFSTGFAVGTTADWFTGSQVPPSITAF